MRRARLFLCFHPKAPADAECLHCISANGSPIKPHCRWVAMEVQGKMKQEQKPERLGAAASSHSRSVSMGKVAFSLLFSGVSSYMPAMLAFLELRSASHLRRLCKVPLCSPNNPLILSCFVPAPCARPPSGPPCLPAVPSQGCVPKSILDIRPFFLIKSSLGPKVTHTLSTPHEFPPAC